jgi:tripartite-type tricarboxylate transporter receptor subunit TctC
VASLNGAFNTAARQIEPRLTELGLQIKHEVSTPDQVNAFIRAELNRYAAVLRAAGVRPE